MKLKGQFDGEQYGVLWYTTNYSVIDETGRVLFGSDGDVWEDFELRDSGIIINNGKAFNLDGTPYDFDSIISRDTIQAFVDREMANEDRNFNTIVDVEEPEYEVVAVYNGVMTVRRHTWIAFISGAAHSVRFEESYLVSESGQLLCRMPDGFSDVTGGGGPGGDHYSGQMGGYGNNGLVWFWHNGAADFGSNIYDHDFSKPLDRYAYGVGYMDMEGNIVVPAIYDSAWPFLENIAPVRNFEGYIGFIDAAGNVVIPLEYDNVGNLQSNGYILVKKDGKWGYIDKNNGVAVPFIYENAFTPGDGLMSVCLDGKYGLVDTRGNVVVPLEYDDISICINGLAYAVKDGYVYILKVK